MKFGRDLGRLIWCAVGAAAGLGLAFWFTGMPHDSPFLLASFGGSAVFLFGLTRAPAAQPRALIGGHLGSALIGVLCFQVFGDDLWVYVISLVLALIFMLGTKTLHPPAGANPLIMIKAQADIFSLWNPVSAGIFVLFAVAIIWSRTLPGKIPYPVKWFEKNPPSTFWGGWLE